MANLLLRTFVFTVAISLVGVFNSSHVVIADALADSTQSEFLTKFNQAIQSGNYSDIVTIIPSATATDTQSSIFVSGMQQLSNYSQKSGRQDFNNVIGALDKSKFSSYMSGAVTDNNVDLINSSLQAASRTSPTAAALQDKLSELQSADIQSSQFIGGMSGLSSDSQKSGRQDFNYVIGALDKSQFSSLITGAKAANNPGLINSSLQAASRTSQTAAALQDKLSELSSADIKSSQFIGGMSSLSSDSQKSGSQDFNYVIGALDKSQFSSLITGANAASNPGLINSSLQAASRTSQTAAALQDKLSELSSADIQSKPFIAGMSGVLRASQNSGRQDFDNVIGALDKSQFSSLITGINAYSPSKLNNLTPETFGLIQKSLAAASRTSPTAEALHDKLSELTSTDIQSPGFFDGMKGLYFDSQGTGSHDFTNVVQAFDVDSGQMASLVKGIGTLQQNVSFLDQVMSNLSPSQMPAGFTYDVQTHNFQNSSGATLSPSAAFPPVQTVSTPPSQFVPTGVAKPAIQSDSSIQTKQIEGQATQPIQAIPK